MSEPLRIALSAAADVDLWLAAGDDGVWLVTGEAAAPRPERSGAAVVDGTPGARLGGWGIVEALTRGATRVRVDPVTPGGRVAGAAAWRFGWSRTDWDELAGAVVAGRVLAAAPPGSVISVAADGSWEIEGLAPTDVVDRALAELSGPELVEPDATVRLATIRVEPTAAGGARVHSVRGLPGPGQAVVVAPAPPRWRAQAALAVLGPDVDAKVARLRPAAPPGADGTVEVHRTRHEHPDARSFTDACAEVLLTATGSRPETADAALAAALEAVATAALPGVWLIGGTTGAAGTGSADPEPTGATLVDTGEIRYSVAVGDETVAIPPAPTAPPPLARRVPDPSAAGRRRLASVSTHPETIAALRDDLRRRRLAAGPADDDSVHWDAQPVRRVPLGRLVRARSGPVVDGRGPGVSAVLRAPDEDAYDWLAWYLTTDRLCWLLPSEEGVAPDEVTRVELPNVDALGFVIRRPMVTPAEHLGEYLRSREADLPQELYWSSALRTSAT